MGARTKWILGILGVVVLVGVVWMLSARSRASATVEKFRAEVATRLASLRGRPAARPAPFGGDEAGNAVELYLKAVDEIYAGEKEIREAVPDAAYDSKKTADDAKVEAMAQKYAPQFDLIRRGLRRRDAVVDYRYEEGFSMNLPVPFVRWNVTAGFMIGVASLRHRQGRDAQALEDLAALVGMSQDLARRGPVLMEMIFVSTEERAARKWREILESHALTAEDAGRICGILDRLDAARPSIAETWEVEEAGVKSAFIKALTHEMPRETGVNRLTLWRYGFSIRIAAADAMERLDAYYRRVDGALRMAPHLRPGAAETIGEEQARDSNPITAMISPSFGKTLERDVVGMMDRNLLRTAMSIAWYEAAKGAPPAALADLAPAHLAKVADCPLTNKPLRYTAGKVWSLGGDRDDDGGKPRTGNDRFSNGDEVWDVKRKP